MNTAQLIAYYVNLLIKQYSTKPRATATISAQVTPIIQPTTTVQVITFSDVPGSGSFVLNWNGNPSTPINWNDNAATVQSDIQGITGLSTITSVGTAASSITVTFTGVTPVAPLLTVTNNTLGVNVTVTETDLTLLQSIQGAYTIGTAIGSQLDVLGKYAGVVRTGQGFNGPITLDDSDYTQLILMAIIRNNSTSAFAQIKSMLAQFFPGQITVTDYENMYMSYAIYTSIGSSDLIQMFVTQGLLPHPMGVGISVIVIPGEAPYFAFRTYAGPNPFSSGFNTYVDYVEPSPWLNYGDAP